MAHAQATRAKPAPCIRLCFPARLSDPGAAELRRGLYVDCETTGFSPEHDAVIELALLPFTYTLAGTVVEVLHDEAQAHRNDPGRPLPAEITHLTGFTDDDVRGERIDVEAASALIERSGLIVAHNARFDRPFVERVLPAARARPWACTRAEVPWVSEGFASQALHCLLWRLRGLRPGPAPRAPGLRGGGVAARAAPPGLGRHRPRRDAPAGTHPDGAPVGDSRAVRIEGGASRPGLPVDAGDAGRDRTLVVDRRRARWGGERARVASRGGLRRDVGVLAPRGDPPAARERIRSLANGPERPDASRVRCRGRPRPGRGVSPLAPASCRRRGP